MASKHQLTSADNEKTAKMSRLYALTDIFKDYPKHSATNLPVTFASRCTGYITWLEIVTVTLLTQLAVYVVVYFVGVR